MHLPLTIPPEMEHQSAKKKITTIEDKESPDAHCARQQAE